MIRCKYPYSQDDEPTNLTEFFSTLTRHVKFSEFAELGEIMFHHWRAHDYAVLVLNAESVIDIRTKIGLGELLLAEVNDAGQLRMLSWLLLEFRRNLSQGFRKAALETNIEVK